MHLKASISTFLLAAAALAPLVRSRERIYHVACVETQWNYAPDGSVYVGGDLKEKAAVFLNQSENRIGNTYKKALFREFTDDTFSQQVARPAYLGLLGPVLRAEVGDTIVVHYWNNCSRPYTMHPHGAQYDKDSEGARYLDGTSGADKADDAVQPGGRHTYRWRVRENEAPTADDPACLPWVYHSHWLSEHDTNAGLIGVLLTCKKGTLGENGLPRGVDKEFVLLFTVLDENLSWYLKDNVETYANPRRTDTEDEDFVESNLMHSINGFMYNNLPEMRMCRGSRVNWYLLGMGTEVDIHGVQFHGQTLTVHGHRTDNFNIFPAQMVAASMVPNSPGRWTLECNVYDHHMAGMTGYYNVDSCDSEEPDPPSGATRKYFIAAEEVEWDYGPSGKNLFDGGSLTKPGSPSAIFFEKGAHRIGGKYKKALYRAYTNDTFSTRVQRTKEEEHMGLLGPALRAEVGDTLLVVFKNKATRPYSLQARGLTFNVTGHDEPVAPGGTRTYTWWVPEDSGPLDDDSSCQTWLYYSSSFPKDTYSGLVGPLLICKKDYLDQDGTQKNVDKEFFLYFTIIDENESWYLEDNVKTYCGDPSGTDVDNEDFKESNKFHGINGFVYGNLPGLHVCNGDEIRWHVIGLGTETDLHTLQINGNQFSHHNLHPNALAVFPGSLATLHMTADNNGEWALVCRTNEHYNAGMKAKYDVRKCQRDQVVIDVGGPTRKYYIAAVEEEWDYTPINNISVKTGQPLKTGQSTSIFTKNSEYLIGTKYKKAVYREFTDATFRQRKERGEAERHLHLLGPTIKAQVGEKIQIVFKNLASVPFSLHAPQAYFNKASEGALYLHNTNETKGSAVPPGDTFTYHWDIPESSGPSDDDPECIASAYFSATDPMRDTNTGLVGPLVICRPGTLADDLKRKDVDREFALMFAVTDENHSWFLDQNIRKYCGKDPASFNKEDEDFVESNKMHGINGRVYGNLDGLSMRVGEKVAWYVLGMGDEVDVHTVHFHGTTVTRFTDVSHRADVLGVFPGTAHVVEMIPHTPAKWLLHCHVNDHMIAGMETLYTVLPKKSDPVGVGARPSPWTVLMFFTWFYTMLNLFA